MALLSLFLPLLGVWLAGLFGRYLGHQGLFRCTWILMSLLLVANSLLFYEVVLESHPITVPLWNWFSIDQFHLEGQFYFDEISVIMLLVINSVSFFVLVYSYDYMINDPHLLRFFTYIYLFMFSMIFLVTNSSLPLLFVGWEGVGVSSFLLISYWFTRIETSWGSILALLMNRVGDVFFLLGVFTVFLITGSVDLLTFLSWPLVNYDWFLLPLFLAAMAKSAQFTLHIWLPYSMEGPTPISALLHAATMVTAGVLLLLRLSLLISASYSTLLFIIIIGSLTTFLGGTLALVSLDMKELIAYSTMSQLGYMVTILGLKYSNLAFFHLIFHAYFKALLFLTAGSIIHAFFDGQDLRWSGGLLNFLPFSFLLAWIGFTSLTGLPFTTGFYSKEAIINSSFWAWGFWSNLIYLITLMTAFLTIAYSYRFLLTLFFKTTRLSVFQFQHWHGYSLHLILPLLLLSLLTIFLGYWTSKFVYLLNLPIAFYHLNVPGFVKLLPLFFFFFLGGVYFFFMNTALWNLSFLQSGYYLKAFYQSICGWFLASSYRLFFKYFDYGFWDLLAPWTGHELYRWSQTFSHYLNPSYFISSLLFFIYLLLYFF